MKLNWGSGIAIFYIFFMVIMISMVIRATQNKVELVQQDYYDKDLNYETFRESKQNTASLKENISIKFHHRDAEIQIVFPQSIKSVQGAVTLYRPSNTLLDKKLSIDLDEDNTMVIPTHRLARGLWRVQLNWNSGDKSYYQEEIITL